MRIQAESIITRQHMNMITTQIDYDQNFVIFTQNNSYPYEQLLPQFLSWRVTFLHLFLSYLSTNTLLFIMEQEAAQQPQSETDKTRLYVSNLDPSVSNRKTDSDLREIFSKYGNIISINVRRNDKHKKLYAFVVFSQPGEAAEAVENLHNSYFGDERIKVEYQRAQRQPREERDREQRKTGRDMGNVTCFRCRKPGHFARDCQQKPDADRNRKRQKEQVRERRKSRSRSHSRRVRQRSSSSSSSSSSRRVRQRRRSRSSSSSSSSSR